MSFVNIYEKWTKVFGHEIPISGRYFLGLSEGNSFSLRFNERKAYAEKQDFFKGGIVDDMVKNLFKNSPIYFIQPANISEFEVTAKPLMEKVVLEGNLNYGGENDLSYLHQYYEWHIDIIEGGYRDLLFGKEYENYSSNLQKIFYNSYEITGCSLLGGFLVSFDKKILLSCFDQGINCIIFNEKEKHIIIDKYKNLIVSS